MRNGTWAVLAVMLAGKINQGSTKKAVMFSKWYFLPFSQQTEGELSFLFVFEINVNVARHSSLYLLLYFILDPVLSE